MSDYGYADHNTFENLDERRQGATFDIAEEVKEPEAVGPLTAIGWLAFLILLACSPALVIAAWGVLT